MPRWMVPWTLPVALLAAVSLVSRPLFCAAWLVTCITIGRLLIHRAAPRGRTAPGTHSYLRKPS
jgi:hypothetical protein